MQIKVQAEIRCDGSECEKVVVVALIFDGSRILSVKTEDDFGISYEDYYPMSVEIPEDKNWAIVSLPYERKCYCPACSPAHAKFTFDERSCK